MSFLPAEPKRSRESGGGAGGGSANKKTKTEPEKPITKEEAIAAIRKDWKIVKMKRKKDKKYKKFLQDKDVVKEIVGINHAMLRYMPEEARDEKGIVYDAVCAMNENEDEVSMHPTAFRWASDRLKNDVEFVREIRQMLLESVNPKRTIQTFDSFVPEAVLRQVEPVSPHWLEKSIEDGDIVAFKAQESIIPTQREALMRKLFHACQENKPVESVLASYRQIFAVLASGQYGQRSLERMVSSGSSRRRELMAEWLVEYAGDDIFQDVTVRLRATSNASTFSRDIAKVIGYQLGKPQTPEKINQFGIHLVGITFGQPYLIISVYREVMIAIRKFGTQLRRELFSAAHLAADQDVPTVNYDQIVLALLQRLVDIGRGLLKAQILGALLLTAASEKYPAVTGYLLDQGANPNFHDPEFYGNKAALEVAVNNGDTDMIRLLLSNGASIEPLGNTPHNRTPLMDSGSLEVTQCLLEFGPDLDKVDDKGYTALHLAVEKGHSPIVAELLRRGANPNIANKFGRTAAFKAVNTLSIECARELFNPRYGVDINHKDTQNWNTVLHCLAKQGSQEPAVQTIFTFIMARNPDLSLENKAFRTALRCSRTPLMSELLVSVGCGAKWTGFGDWDDDRKLFKDLPASTFDQSPVVLRLQEDEMQGDDETVAPVRLGCEHVFNATFLRQWLNTNKYGYEGSTTQFKTKCPMCRKEITKIELLSAAKAANWDNFEGQAKAEEQKMEAAIKEWEKDEEYTQKKAALDAAAAALKAAQEALKAAEDATREKERERKAAREALKAAEDATREKERERREIRDASDAKQKELRDKRLLQQLKDLGL